MEKAQKDDLRRWIKDNWKLVGFNLLMGVLGNSIYSLISFLLGFFTITTFLVVFITVTVISTAITAYGKHKSIAKDDAKKIKRLEVKEGILKELLVLNQSMISLISGLVMDKDKRKDNLKGILDYLFSSLAEIFVTDFSGATIFCPRKDGDKNWLVEIYRFGPPNLFNEIRTFYIGTDKNFETERGIAGFSYVDNEAILVTFDVVNKQSIPSDKRFTFSSPKKSRVLYSSSLSIPIINNPDKNTAGKILGVMCINSMVKDAFDDEQIRDLFATLCTTSIYAIINLYNELEAKID